MQRRHQVTRIMTLLGRVMPIKTSKRGRRASEGLGYFPTNAIFPRIERRKKGRDHRRREREPSVYLVLVVPLTESATDENTSAHRTRLKQVDRGQATDQPSSGCRRQPGPGCLWSPWQSPRKIRPCSGPSRTCCAWRRTPSGWSICRPLWEDVVRPRSSRHGDSTTKNRAAEHTWLDGARNLVTGPGNILADLVGGRLLRVRSDLLLQLITDALTTMSDVKGLATVDPMSCDRW